MVAAPANWVAVRVVRREMGGQSGCESNGPGRDRWELRPVVGEWLARGERTRGLPQFCSRTRPPYNEISADGGLCLNCLSQLRGQAQLVKQVAGGGDQQRYLIRAEDLRQLSMPLGHR